MPFGYMHLVQLLNEVSVLSVQLKFPPDQNSQIAMFADLCCRNIILIPRNLNLILDFLYFLRLLQLKFTIDDVFDVEQRKKI